MSEVVIVVVGLVQFGVGFGVAWMWFDAKRAIGNDDIRAAAWDEGFRAAGVEFETAVRHDNPYREVRR